MFEKFFVYPIKSCGGIEFLSELELTLTGPRHDRVFTLVDENGRFLSQRTLPRMSLIRTRLTDCPFTGFGNSAVQIDAIGMDTHYIPLLYGEKIMRDDFRQCKITIHQDACKGIDLGNEYAEWFSIFLKRKCRLVRQVPQFPRRRSPSSVGHDIEVSFADAFPLLIMTEESLADLNHRIVRNDGEPVSINRFRPNIVISGARPYDEDNWGYLEIGEVILKAAKKCVRCIITTTNQDTAEREREPLKTLSTYRRNSAGEIELGRNFVVIKAGTIRKEDSLTIFE